MKKIHNTTILNAGIYDVFHHGHLSLLEKMKDQAGKNGLLKIVIHDDRSAFLIKKKIPIQNVVQRIANLYTTGLVDDVIVCGSVDPAFVFAEIICDEWDSGNQVIYMRGDDMKQNFPGQWQLDEFEIPIIFLPYTKDVSSTMIREKL